MTYQEERKFNEPPVDHEPPLRSGIEWGLPLGLGGAVIVIGLVFYSVSHQSTTTASHTGGAQNTPAQNAEKAVPPAKTQ